MPEQHYPQQVLQFPSLPATRLTIFRLGVTLYLIFGHLTEDDITWLKEEPRVSPLHVIDECDPLDWKRKRPTHTSISINHFYSFRESKVCDLLILATSSRNPDNEHIL
jgi:hypothetical protein